ncbi:MAG: hypothetical protein AAGC44_13845 [Planctomycetota bacterium]
MDLTTKLVALAIIATVFIFVTFVLRVLGAWSNYQIRRHDLVAESKRRRIEYLRAVSERRGMSNSSIEVVD